MLDILSPQNVPLVRARGPVAFANAKNLFTDTWVAFHCIKELNPVGVFPTQEDVIDRSERKLGVVEMPMIHNKLLNAQEKIKE